MLLYFAHYLAAARTGVLLSSGITLSIINSILTSKCHFYNGEQGGKAIILLKPRYTTLEYSICNNPYTTPNITSKKTQAS